MVAAGIFALYVAVTLDVPPVPDCWSNVTAYVFAAQLLPEIEYPVLHVAALQRFATVFALQLCAVHVATPVELEHAEHVDVVLPVPLFVWPAAHAVHVVCPVAV
jgi:hypothetical protein